MCGVCPAALPCKQVRLMRDHSREGRIRTGDLLVMSQASFQLLHIAMLTQGPKATWVRSSDILRFRDKGILRSHKSYSHSGTLPLVPAGDQLQRADKHIKEGKKSTWPFQTSFSLIIAVILVNWVNLSKAR